MEKTRIVYFDFLRIFAALAVVMVHAASCRYGKNPYSDLFYFSIVRWPVPIFIMISGTLFLEPTKNITINNILKKYIFRIAILFIVWSLFYLPITCFSENNFSLRYIIFNFVVGFYHQWFLYAIATLYLITPLLRPIIEKRDKNLLLYLLIIWFIMASIVPLFGYIFPKIGTYYYFMMTAKLHFSFPLYFIGYFILGYYLHNYVNIRNKILPIIIISLCTLITIFGDIKYSSGAATFFLDHFSPFIVIISVYIFLIMKNMCSKIKQVSDFILNLSGLTLGVYLIHPFFLKIVQMLNIYNCINSLLNDKDFIAVPVVFIVVSICSFGSVYLLSKLPIIKKYCL